MTAFLLAVGTIYFAAVVGGELVSKVQLPRVIGEMAAGLLLGNSLLGHVWPRAEQYLFGDGVLAILSPIGIFLVLLYVAVVGAELDKRVLEGRTNRLVVAAGAGLVVAFGGAGLLGWGLSDLEPGNVPRWAYYAFLTAAILVTAVPVLARILDETGLTSTRIGTVTLTVSVADDFIAFSIVAIAIAAATKGNIALAITGTVLLGSLLLPRNLARGLRSRIRRMPTGRALSVAILALVAGGVNSLGASTLVAAFVIGALVWRPQRQGDVVPGSDLAKALVPLYIVYAGLPIDVTHLVHPRLLVAIVLTTALAIGTKIVSCLIASRILSLNRTETWGLIVLRNTRGLTELVALNLGYKAGILSQDLYTVFFAMALLTTAAGGLVAMTVLRPLVLAEHWSRDRIRSSDAAPSAGIAG
ncbi:MAG: cation:proton antiporter [Gaiellaceae bacterium]